MERQLSFERIKTKTKIEKKPINLSFIIENFIKNHRFHFRLRIPSAITESQKIDTFTLQNEEDIYIYKGYSMNKENFFFK